MSVPSFDPTRVLGCGTFGQETARKMDSALRRHSFFVRYNGNKEFTILNTSDISKETIEKIFQEDVYRGWKPVVLNKTDEDGNRLAKLSPVLYYSLNYIRQ